MRPIFILTLTLAAALPARADLAPEPTDPTTPEGAIVWLSILAAAAALAVIWFRRKR